MDNILDTALKGLIEILSTLIEVLKYTGLL